MKCKFIVATQHTMITQRISLQFILTICSYNNSSSITRFIVPHRIHSIVHQNFAKITMSVQSANAREASCNHSPLSSSPLRSTIQTPTDSTVSSSSCSSPQLASPHHFSIRSYSQSRKATSNHYPTTRSDSTSSSRHQSGRLKFFSTVSSQAPAISTAAPMGRLSSSAVSQTTFDSHSHSNSLWHSRSRSHSYCHPHAHADTPTDTGTQKNSKVNIFPMSL